MNENSDVPEEVMGQTEDEASEIIEESAEAPPVSEKIKKHIKAIHLVEKAKTLVKEANEQAEACKFLLEANLKKYEEARSELGAGGFDACISLLKKLGCQTISNEQRETKTLLFEPKEEWEPMVLKDVSSGRFRGFIYALLGGVVAAAGLVYLATEKLGIVLDANKIPSEDVMQSILAWFSTTIGIHEDVYIGTGLLSLVVLLVMGIIYVTHVRLKESSNLHFAVKQFVEAEIYTEQKANCKAEMEKVDAHMKDAVATLKTYEVLFNEQKGKLQRILYIEGEKEKSRGYHDKSFLEICETEELICAIREFMDMPMSEEGKLSGKSILFLQSAKDQMDKMLKRLY